MTSVRPNPAKSPPLAVSSWSLHRALGLTYPNRPDHDVEAVAEATYGPGRLSLLDMPRAVAALGIDRIEVCSFHVPRRDAEYATEFRAALAEAGVTLQTLLIEYGDITNPETRERDLAWIESWIDTAAALGAEQARVIAGRAEPTRAALDSSVDGLIRLGRHGEARRVRVVTENWFELLPGPREVRYLFDRLDETVGLNGDFGNWSGEGKYADLQAIFDLAICCHAKADFSDGVLNAEDYRRCLDASIAAGFRGPFTLIYDGPHPDEFAHLLIERDFIRHHFATTRANGG
ncbi:sugar phosphate isomerase [Kaistia sp. 32K]|uniref:sugar phosphate isomerase/epimerase family protein n=1 Tax=Kaistia sp. 32K TaxID=2795690 RepID=UPI001915A577|nr:TIM barrel protein [Kaistia sp. 32K]BCP55956.1 sugar phosphate isomerase [Kaistia sp. 32K]